MGTNLTFDPIHTAAGVTIMALQPRAGQMQTSTAGASRKFASFCRRSPLITRESSHARGHRDSSSRYWSTRRDITGLGIMLGITRPAQAAPMKKNELSDAEYRVLCESGTEPPFSSPLNSEIRPGVFS